MESSLVQQALQVILIIKFENYWLRGWGEEIHEKTEKEWPAREETNWSVSWGKRVVQLSNQLLIGKRR